MSISLSPISSSPFLPNVLNRVEEEKHTSASSSLSVPTARKRFSDALLSREVIDEAGNLQPPWAGHKPIPLTYNEAVMLREKLYEPFQVVEDVHGTLKETSMGEILGFLSVSYNDPSQICVKRLLLKGGFAMYFLLVLCPDYLVRLFHTMGLEDLLPLAQEALCLPLPPDADAVVSLKAPEPLSHMHLEAIRKVIYQQMGILTQKSLEREAAHDPYIETAELLFQIIDPPDSYWQLCLQGRSPRESVFHLDDLAIPLDSLLGSCPSFNIRPLSQFGIGCQGIFDHLRGVVKAKKANEIERNGLFRLHTWQTRGYQPDQKHFIEQLFETFRANNFTHPDAMSSFIRRAFRWIEAHHPRDRIAGFFFLLTMTSFLASRLPKVDLSQLWKAWASQAPTHYPEGVSGETVSFEKSALPYLSEGPELLLLFLDLLNLQFSLGISQGWEVDHASDVPLWTASTRYGHQQASFHVPCDTEKVFDRMFAFQKEKPSKWEEMASTLVPLPSSLPEEIDVAHLSVKELLKSTSPFLLKVGLLLLWRLPHLSDRKRSQTFVTVYPKACRIIGTSGFPLQQARAHGIPVEKSVVDEKEWIETLSRISPASALDPQECALQLWKRHEDGKSWKFSCRFIPALARAHPQYATRALSHLKQKSWHHKHPLSVLKLLERCATADPSLLLTLFDSLFDLTLSRKLLRRAPNGVNYPQAILRIWLKFVEKDETGAFQTPLRKWAGAFVKVAPAHVTTLLKGVEEKRWWEGLSSVEVVREMLQWAKGSSQIVQVCSTIVEELVSSPPNQTFDKGDKRFFSSGLLWFAKESGRSLIYQKGEKLGWIFPNHKESRWIVEQDLQLEMEERFSKEEITVKEVDEAQRVFERHLQTEKLSAVTVAKAALRLVKLDLSIRSNSLQEVCWETFFTLLSQLTPDLPEEFVPEIGQCIKDVFESALPSLWFRRKRLAELSEATFSYLLPRLSIDQRLPLLWGIHLYNLPLSCEGEMARLWVHSLMFSVGFPPERLQALVFTAKRRGILEQKDLHPMIVLFLISLMEHWAESDPDKTLSLFETLFSWNLSLPDGNLGIAWHLIVLKTLEENEHHAHLLKFCRLLYPHEQTYKRVLHICATRACMMLIEQGEYQGFLPLLSTSPLFLEHEEDRAMLGAVVSQSIQFLLFQSMSREYNSSHIAKQIATLIRAYPEEYQENFCGWEHLIFLFSEKKEPLVWDVFQAAIQREVITGNQNNGILFHMSVTKALGDLRSKHLLRLLYGEISSYNTLFFRGELSEEVLLCFVHLMKGVSDILPILDAEEKQKAARKMLEHLDALKHRVERLEASYPEVNSDNIASLLHEGVLMFAPHEVTPIFSPDSLLSDLQNGKMQRYPFPMWSQRGEFVEIIVIKALLESGDPSIKQEGAKRLGKFMSQPHSSLLWVNAGELVNSILSSQDPYLRQMIYPLLNITRKFYVSKIETKKCIEVLLRTGETKDLEYALKLLWAAYIYEKFFLKKEGWLLLRRVYLRLEKLPDEQYISLGEEVMKMITPFRVELAQHAPESSIEQWVYILRYLSRSENASIKNILRVFEGVIPRLGSFKHSTYAPEIIENIRVLLLRVLSYPEDHIVNDVRKRCFAYLQNLSAFPEKARLKYTENHIRGIIDSISPSHPNYQILVLYAGYLIDHLKANYRYREQKAKEYLAEVEAKAKVLPGVQIITKSCTVEEAKTIIS